MIMMIRLVTTLTLISAPAQSAVAKDHKKSSTKSKVTAAPKKIHGEAKPDMEARALVRRIAPFVVEERYRGHSILIHKDGTFSREEDSESNEAQGHWKVVAGKLRLKWTTGEEYSYSITFSGKTPLIVGQKAKSKGRYVLNSAD